LAYVFPSLKEGFSLTPLEAQAVELPCVISDIPCHREVYGDSVEYFNPTDVANMAEKMNKVVNDSNLRSTLAAKGLVNVKRYDWTKTAQITLDVFNKSLSF
jgi:glycosyltransferase involved in cell wall biosynthesis